MNAATASDALGFVALDQHIRIDSADAAALDAVRLNFSAFAGARDDAGAPSLHFRIDRGAGGGFTLARDGVEPVRCPDLADLLYDIEKDVTVELQKLRADLLFLHAAAVVLNGRAALIASASGGGKSTTTWALLHHGFGYLSDELSPVDVASMRVLAYPHAICLKQRPTAYRLPSQTLELGRTMHVPVSSSPTPEPADAAPVGAVFLLKYSSDNTVPTVTRIGAAQAAARLYVNALNPLAHPLHGLDAVARIAEAVPCFDVAAGDLAVTSALIGDTLRAASKATASA